MGVGPTSKKLNIAALISSFLFIPLCGVIDHLTGAEIGFSIFYLLPILSITWLSGWKYGSIAALASGVVWLIANFQTGNIYSHPLIPYWNAGVRTGYYFIIVLLFYRIRVVNRNLESLVHERTRELYESEERFRDLVQNSQDLICTHNLEGLILSVNPASIRALQYEEDEIIGKNIRDFLVPQVRPGFDKYIEDLRQNGKASGLMFVQTRSGEERVWEYMNSLRTEGVSKPIVRGMARDATERWQADQALRESEERFRSTFDQAAVGVVHAKLDGQFLRINQRFCDIVGYTTEELQARTFAEITHPEDIEADLENIQRILDKEIETFSMEKRYQRKDSSIVWVNLTVSIVREPTGEPKYFIGIVEDIDERKRTEAERQSMFEITQGVISTESLTELLELIRQSLAKIIYAENFFVIFHNKSTGFFEEVYAVDQYDDPMPPSRLEKSITSYVFRTGQPLLLDQAKFDDLVVSGEVELVGENSAAWLGTPLRKPGETIGVMAVQNYEDANCYTERDRDFFALVGAQVALVIDRKRAEMSLQQRTQELQALYQISIEINTQTDLDALLVTLVQHATALINVDSGGLYLMEPDGEKLKLVVGHNMAEHYIGATIKTGEGMSGKVAKTGKPMAVEEYHKWDGRARIFDETPFLRTLGIPLKVRGRVTGVLIVSDRIRSGPFSEEEIRLVNLFADQAAISLENARLFNDAQRRLRQTRALREIDQAITGTLHIQNVLSIVLKHTLAELDVDAAVVLLYDPIEKMLKYELGSGFWSSALQHSRLRLGEGYAGRAALEKRTIHIPNLKTRHTDFLRSPLFHTEGFFSYFGIPLIAKSEIMGVLEIFHREQLNPDPEWLHFMETLAGQVAIAINNATLYKDLQQSNVELMTAYDATIAGWSSALDLRDKETETHTERVTDLSVKLAHRMGIEQDEIVHVRRGALLHDIGKMGVPDAILLKPDKLTPEEWEIMKKHPVHAFEMLSPITYLSKALDIPYCHHEKWDGNGYPRGLKGEQIPIAARIFAVIDVWDALTSDRPYRSAWTEKEALKYIREQSGVHFDPQVVSVFLEMIAKGEITQ